MGNPSGARSLPGILEPVGPGQMDLDCSSVTPLAVPGNANVAEIQTLLQPIRYRDDGTDPSTTSGMQLAAGNSKFYTATLSKIRLREEAAGAQVNVLYYRVN